MKRWEYVLPISPLEGEMPGRAEGVTPHAPSIRYTRTTLCKPTIRATDKSSGVFVKTAVKGCGTSRTK